MRTTSAAVRVSCLLLLVAVAGCSSTPDASPHGRKPSDAMVPPALGTCRLLAGGDVVEHTNDDPVVPCSSRHTAQTFATGSLPASAGSTYAAPRQGRFVHERCGAAFGRFLGADESLTLRIQLSWAWFAPSRKAWDKGARWYRCDVIGSAPDAALDDPNEPLQPLPTSARGMFSKGLPDDHWVTCARGRSVAGSIKVACSEPHDWRAVTAIKVGQPKDPYPGDAIVRARSRDRCSDWVGAWLHYTPDYDFGYSWFHRAEWEAGNRRSVCWAKTDR